jgi:hypothetical protein
MMERTLAMFDVLKLKLTQEDHSALFRRRDRTFHTRLQPIAIIVMSGIDARYMFGGFIFIPIVLFATKVVRMDSRDRHEVQMDLRYRATFWEKANGFIREMNSKILVSVEDDLNREKNVLNTASAGGKSAAATR